MSNLFQGLPPEKIKLLIAFYEKQTNRSAYEITEDEVEGTREKKLRYILGIMKNRFYPPSVESQGLGLLVAATKAGVPIEDLKLYSMSSPCWSAFREKIESLIPSPQ